MNTDRELLEAAAKAAGLAYEHDWGGVRVDPEFNEFYAWRPLTDDGDALRLAVKLQLAVDIGSTAAHVYRNDAGVVEPHGADPYATTRLCITRAAAAIGKDMP